MNRKRLSEHNTDELSIKVGLKHLVGNLDKTKIAVTMKIRKKVMTLRIEQEEAVEYNTDELSIKVGREHLVGNLDKTKIAVTMKIRKKVMTLRMEQEEAVGI